MAPTFGGNEYFFTKSMQMYTLNIANDKSIRYLCNCLLWELCVIENEKAVLRHHKLEINPALPPPLTASPLPLFPLRFHHIFRLLALSKISTCATVKRRLPRNLSWLSPEVVFSLDREAAADQRQRGAAATAAAAESLLEREPDQPETSGQESAGKQSRNHPR